MDRWRRGSRGPLPQLTHLQLLTALVLIEQRAPIGRRLLSEELEIKDGVVRGLLERLAEQDIVRVATIGVELSGKGRKQLREILRELSVKKIVSFESLELAPGSLAVAAQVSQAYGPVLTGVSQRDESIKAGATGAITITAKDGKLRIPPDNKSVAELAPRDNNRFLAAFKPRDKDVIVIGFAEKHARALAGTLAAILSLEKP